MIRCERPIPAMLNEPKTILLLEDAHEVRAWIRSMLEEIFCSSQIHEAENLQVARECLSRENIDLMLVDLNLPDGSGIELLGEVQNAVPEIYSVVITVFDDDQHLFDALKAGAKGYLLKNKNTDQFKQQLTLITSGQPALSPSIAYRILQSFVPERHDDLTDRETQILILISQGLRLKDVAVELSISVHTVGDHVKNIYRKLEIKNRAEAAVVAARRGLIKHSPHK